MTIEELEILLQDKLPNSSFEVHRGGNWTNPTAIRIDYSLNSQYGVFILSMLGADKVEMSCYCCFEPPEVQIHKIYSTDIIVEMIEANAKIHSCAPWPG